MGSYVGGHRRDALPFVPDPRFRVAVFPNPAPEGTLLEGPTWYLSVLASVLVPLSCLLFACFLGGRLGRRLRPATRP
jgi:hypothetical protein